MREINKTTKNRLNHGRNDDAVSANVALLADAFKYTGLFEMIVGVLTTCHTQYS